MPAWRNHVPHHRHRRPLGFEHSEAMPLIYNDQGLGIYRMVFFARHKLPKRIWGEVARGQNPNLDLPF